MRLAVLFFTLSVFLTLLAMFQGVGTRSDQMRKRFNQVVETERTYSDEELRKSFSERVLKPAIRRLSEGIRRSAGNSKPVGMARQPSSSTNSSKPPALR